MKFSHWLTAFLLLISFQFVLGNPFLGNDSIPLIETDTLTNQIEEQALVEEIATQEKSKITPGVPTEFDWIKMINGKEMEVEVRRISERFVFYSQPGDMDMDWVDRREVRTIYYRTGRVEHITQKEVEIKEVKDWKLIISTQNPEDVADMIKIDDLEVKHEATTRHQYYRPKTLETSAEIVLKRQAANLDADVILITKVEHHRAYGDPPAVSISATAYKER